MDKYEISHWNSDKERMQYNSYHNCESIEQAISKHKEKGYEVSNIKSVTRHTKYKYDADELSQVINELEGVK